MPPRRKTQSVKALRSLADRVAACDSYFRIYGIRRMTMTDLAYKCQTTEAELRHLFPSMDRVVAGYLAREAEADQTFPVLRDEQESDPMTVLRNYFEAVQRAASDNYDGRYRMARIAVDLPHDYRISRELVQKWKAAELLRIQTLCSRAKFSEPELLANKLYLLLEGARWGLEVFGPHDSPSQMLVAASENLMATHVP